MKKLLYASTLMLFLLSGCSFKFLRILQPQRATVSQTLYYPIDIIISRDTLPMTGRFEIKVPESMSINTNEVLSSIRINGEEATVQVKDSVTTSGEKIYEFSHANTIEESNMHVKMIMSLNTGSVPGSYSIRYRTGTEGYYVGSETKSKTIEIGDASTNEALINGDCLTNDGTTLTPFDFYVRLSNPNEKTVSGAELILSCEGQDDLRIQMNPEGDLNLDYFATLNLPNAGNYFYYMEFSLSDGTTLRYPESGTETGPVVTATSQTIVDAPFLETFELTSSTIDDWSIVDGPISMLIGTPSTQNKVSTSAYEGTNALGTDITGNGINLSENVGFYDSPMIKISNEDEIVLDFMYKAYSENTTLPQPYYIFFSCDGVNWNTIYSIAKPTTSWEHVRLNLTSVVFGDYIQLRFLNPMSGKEVAEGVMFDNVGLNAKTNPLTVTYFDLKESVIPGETYKIPFYIKNNGDSPDSYSIRLYNAKIIGDATDYATTIDSYGDFMNETGDMNPGDEKRLEFVVTLPETTEEESYEYLVQVTSHTDTDFQNTQKLVISVDKSSGGPDDFGYTWVNSRDSSCTAFNWVDTTGHRTVADYELSYPISFSKEFDFYGTAYSSVFLNTNGYLTFGSSSQESIINQIPNAIVPNNYIAFLSNDTRYIDLTSSVKVGIVNGWGTIKEQLVVITFSQLGNMVGNATMDVQVILNSIGDVRIQYKNIDKDFNLDNYLVGIENADGTDGLTYQYGLGRLRDSLALEFRYPGRDVFSDLYPKNQGLDDVSLFAQMSWIAPRGAQNITLYLAEKDVPLDENSIVYSGENTDTYSPELEANTFYHYTLKAELADGSVVSSTVNTFKTMRDMVTVEGTVFTEDGVTLAPNIPISFEAYCLMQGTYSATDTTDEWGNYSIKMPSCESLYLSIETEGCESYNQTVSLQDTTTDGTTIFNDITLQTKPVIIDLTFHELGEYFAQTDTVCYFYLPAATWFWSNNLKNIKAEVTLPPGVTSSVDFNTLTDYSEPIDFVLTTSGGTSKKYTLKHSVFASLADLDLEHPVQIRDGLWYFGNYTCYTYSYLNLNNKGASCWESKGISMSTTRPDYVYKNGSKWKVGMVPGVFTLRPTNIEDLISSVSFEFEENCGERCSQAIAYRNGRIVDIIYPEKFKSKRYYLHMHNEPADLIVFTSYEASVFNIRASLEKGGGNPMVCPLVESDGKVLNDTTEVSVEYFKRVDGSTSDWELFRPAMIRKDGKLWAKLVPGKFILRTVPAMPDSINFNPTYSGDAVLWGNADTLTLNYRDEIAYTINCNPLNAVSGSHTINGAIDVVQTSFKSTSNTPDLFGYQLILFDVDTDLPIAYALTNEDGLYTFTNIPTGSYYLVAENEGMQSSPLLYFEVTEENAVVPITGTFTFNLDEKSIALNGLYTGSEKATTFYPEVFPNPSMGTFTIPGNAVALEVIDATGTIVERKINLKLNQQVNVTKLSDGYYILRITYTTGITTQSLIIRK